MKILLVEDNQKLAELTAKGLRLMDFVVDVTDNAEQALYLTSVEQYDVLVLDRMLPNNQDGLNICKQLREEGDHTPILMLTAQGELSQRVAGFESGADDYLVKPFALSELAARIRAIRRRVATEPCTGVITIKDLKIYTAKQKVVKNGVELRLSRKLWNVFEYLTLHRGQTISKSQLIDHVWGLESDVLENAVESTIRHLRKKLGDDNGNIIETVHGFGYRMNV